MELRNRYQSLDVFRGLDVALMIIVNTPGDYTTTFSALHHAEWNGFTLTDLVFPTFLFVVGTSLSFSLGAYQSLGTSAVVKKVLKRTAIIFLLGYLSYWFPFVEETTGSGWHMKPLGDTRIMGVLQRIALCYGFGTLIIHVWKTKGAVIFSIVALLGYWWLLNFTGDLTITGNAVVSLDRWLLGESHLYHRHNIPFDPEGILSTLPAIVNVIAGYCAGIFLKEKGVTYAMLSRLLMVGALLVAVGLTWDFAFPINKKLWTSSFVLYTTGIDLLMLGILVYVIEMLQWKRWTYFFVVLGRNTLFIYLLSQVLDTCMDIISTPKGNVHDWIYMSIFKPLPDPYIASLLFSVGYMLLCWLVGFWMDKRGIYIKI